MHLGFYNFFGKSYIDKIKNLKITSLPMYVLFFNQKISQVKLAKGSITKVHI